MSKTRIRNRNDEKHQSDTFVIQSQFLQASSQDQQASTFRAEKEEDAAEGFAKMCEYRYEEIMKIEKEALEIKEMFSDMAVLVNEQQPLIEAVVATLQDAEKHIEKAEERLVEAETGKKCAIL
jgi:hypothetical protein